MNKFTFHDFKEKVMEHKIKFICGGAAAVLGIAAAITLMPPLGIAASVLAIIVFTCEFSPMHEEHNDANCSNEAKHDVDSVNSDDTDSISDDSSIESTYCDIELTIIGIDLVDYIDNL